MCGIAGIIQNDPQRFHAEHLQKMTAAIRHRGPDGEGFWQNESRTVLFGHRRLSIIDLSPAGEQPMHYLDRYVLMHNGEIYNYVELREELRRSGYKFHSATDTEVIAAAYDRWKENCVDHFDGMFAFCIWDKQENLFFAARDRFGEKPFYYTIDDGCLLFASEMKSFWAAGIPKKPNLQLLFNFLSIGYTDNPELPEETFYNDINKLPAASWLKYRLAEEELTIVTYWDLDTRNINSRISEEEAILQFRSLFTSSVKRRLRSDVPVGTSLSGGLDSSSIVAVCRQLEEGKKIHHCFTASFQGFEKDETQYAQELASSFGLQQHLAALSSTDIINNLDKLAYHQEEPFGSASVFAQYKVYELARQQHVTVLLDGQGADETLAGYHKYYKWYWQELFRKMKLIRSGELKAAHSLGIKESFGFKNMLAAVFPGMASVVLERQYLLRALKQKDLEHDFIRANSKEAYYSPPEHFSLNGILYFNTRTHGLEELLRYADRNSMAHSREVRLPFLSHELVEFLFTLPARFKIREGWTKWLLRQTMKNELPASICWRKDKVGFEPPQRKWMEDPAVKEMINAAKELLVKERILNPSVMGQPVSPSDAHASDNHDWRYFSAAILFR